MVVMTTVREYAPSLAEVSTATTDGIYEVTFITEGKGSTGYYSRELLETYGAKTFRAGYNTYFNHIKWHEDPEDRDITTAAGKILDSWFAVEDGVGKVKGKIQVAPMHREFVEFFKDNIGLSIFASGTSEYSEETGSLNITSFDTEFPYTSVDFVIAAGRGGKIDKKMEQYRNSLNEEEQVSNQILESYRIVESLSSKKPTVTLAEDKNNKRGNSLELKDIAEKLDKLTQTVENLVAEKVAEAKAEIDQQALESAVSERVSKVAETLKAIEEADILDIQKDELRESVAEGAEVTVAMIEKEVTKTKALREAVSVEVSGQFSESENTKGGRDLNKLSFFQSKTGADN